MTEIILSPSQQNVIDMFPDFLMGDDTEMTITGFAGSGKSFLVKYLADMGEHQQKLVHFLAPDIPIRKVFFTATTNKAADVLKSFLSRKTSTIHRLLGLKVKNDYTSGKQVLTDDGTCENLRHSIVVIDEASMINAELLRTIRFVCKQHTDCKIIYIGDKYQLPPVKEDVCPVFLAALGNSKNIFNLVEIQRQVADSPIIQLSAEYRKQLDDHQVKWPTIKTQEPAIVHYEDKMPFFHEIAKAFMNTRAPKDTYKIIAWSNERVRAYNDWVRQLHGRPKIYEVGERVITNQPLFKGRSIVASTDSQHIIKTISPAKIDECKGHMISVEGDTPGVFFQPSNWAQANARAKAYAGEKDWSKYWEIKERWADLRPVHATTVHKSQGSTYNEVFVDLNNIGKCNRWKDVARLAYVAVTRASTRVHIYGSLYERYSKEPTINLMEHFKHACIQT